VPIVIGDANELPADFEGIFCPKPVKGRALRLVREDECGNLLCDDPPGTNPNNAVQSTGFLMLSVAPDIEPGEDILIKLASGAFCIHDKDCDRIKGWNVELDLCGFPFPMLEMLVDLRALTQVDGEDTNIIGGAWPVPGDGCLSPVSMEVWAKNADAAACEGGTFPFVKVIWPLTKNWVMREALEFGPTTAATVKLRGYAEANANWGLGPVPAEQFGNSLTGSDFFAWVGASGLPDPLEACAYASLTCTP
jgi:hypothetical protein